MILSLFCDLYFVILAVTCKINSSLALSMVMTEPPIAISCTDTQKNTKGNVIP